MTTEERILQALKQANALTITEVARMIEAPRAEVAECLHQLDEDEKVHMRNGFYQDLGKWREQQIANKQR